MIEYWGWMVMLYLVVLDDELCMVGDFEVVWVGLMD